MSESSQVWHEWRLIETLPNDYETVIVFVPGRDPFEAMACRNGTYEDPVYNEWDGEGATHWMPKPPPPIGAEPAKDDTDVQAC